MTKQWRKDTIISTQTQYLCIEADDSFSSRALLISFEVTDVLRWYTGKGSWTLILCRSKNRASATTPYIGGVASAPSYTYIEFSRPYFYLLNVHSNGSDKMREICFYSHILLINILAFSPQYLFKLIFHLRISLYKSCNYKLCSNTNINHNTIQKVLEKGVFSKIMVQAC